MSLGVAQKSHPKNYLLDSQGPVYQFKSEDLLLRVICHFGKIDTSISSWLKQCAYICMTMCIYIVVLNITKLKTTFIHNFKIYLRKCLYESLEWFSAEVLALQV